jgi:hypothetical protein
MKQLFELGCNWASGHVSLRDLIRNGNADQLRDTRADRSGRRTRPPRGAPEKLAREGRACDRRATR